jgi:DNA-binding CsgD family transcriptional regulator
MFQNDLQHGREYYTRCAWKQAYVSLSSADKNGRLAPEDLERLATSAYLLGLDLQFQQLQERLYRCHVEQEAWAQAARCTFWLALTSLFRGEVGRANAWIARGQRLIEALDCVERGYMLLPIAEQQLRAGDTSKAHDVSADAARIGEQFADADLTSAAQHVQGRVLLQQGHVLAGLVKLDEAMLCVVAGEVSPIMTGLLYCSVLDACRQVYALGRAQEWTAAFSRACERQPDMVAFTDTCLVHRAEIMQFRGAWPDAMAEACRACERCQQGDRQPPAAALYQQAEIHRLRGEFAKANEAYCAASERGCEPQPGLALLRLAQGRIDSARVALGRLLSVTNDPMRRAALLPAQLEVMLASGNLQGARAVHEELEHLAELFDTDVLRATATQAHGAIAIADGDAAAALEPLHRAFGVWEHLGAPYEAARVRVLLGQACLALGDEEAKRLEFAAARTAFERLGARYDLTRLAALDAPGESRERRLLTHRELDVLRLISTGNTNKAIAARLQLSERTIDRHVGNILRKLEVPSRAAAIAYAYDHSLF